MAGDGRTPTRTTAPSVATPTDDVQASGESLIVRLSTLRRSPHRRSQFERACPSAINVEAAKGITGRALSGSQRARSTAAPPPAARPPGDSTDGLLELLALSLWPIVETAFRDVEDTVDGRFYQLADLQVVVSRAPAREAGQRDAERLVTLEVWPAAGPRLLVVEWSGRRPYVVHRRDGDWLPRLIRASRQFPQPEWLPSRRPDR